MYVKTTCPHCENKSYIDIDPKITTKKNGHVLEDINIVDTLKEEDFVLMLMNFIAENSKMLDKNELKNMLNNNIIVSPIITEAFISALLKAIEIA